MEAAAKSRPFWLLLAGGFALLLIFLIIVRLLMGLAPAPDEEAVRGAERAKVYQELQAENAKKLQHYAWVDKAKGTVQIPIERAMELTIVELNSKKPAPAGPIATPAQSPPPAPAAPPAATPAGSPSPGPAGSPSPGPAVSPSPGPAVSPSPGPAVSPSPGPAVSPSPGPAASPPPAPAAPPPAPGATPTPGSSPATQSASL
jgi:hypothetical protein